MDNIQELVMASCRSAVASPDFDDSFQEHSGRFLSGAAEARGGQDKQQLSQRLSVASSVRTIKPPAPGRHVNVRRTELQDRMTMSDVDDIMMSNRAINVLIVDDNERDCVMVQEFLSKVSSQVYETTVASRFDVGLSYLMEHQYDVCLVDSCRNPHDGIEFIESTQEIEGQPPMIMLTGVGDHMIDVQAMRAGASDFLQKDELSPKILERSIRYAIDRYRARRRTASITRQLKEQNASRAALQEQLVATSRQIGMAEVATGVLHNVGNVLNSVNVSATLLLRNLISSRVATLSRAAEIIAGQDDLAQFVTADSQGRHFPRLLTEIAARLQNERDAQEAELRTLIDSIEHIKQIVSMQQSFAHAGGATESLNVVDLLEDAVTMNDAGLLRHSIDVVREIDGNLPLISTDRHKVLQVLVNLISNAKHALTATDGRNNRMTLAATHSDGCIRIQVSDNGVGIPPENLTRIFGHGFTTKADGHGFGLHSSALAAQELGGSLSVHSDGPGQGATFILNLPVEKEPACTV